MSSQDGELQGDGGSDNKHGDIVDAEDVKLDDVLHDNTVANSDSGLTRKDDKIESHGSDDVVKEKSDVPEAVAEDGQEASTTQHRWEVWRRYSEFEVLKNFLQIVYPHVSRY